MLNDVTRVNDKASTEDRKISQGHVERARLKCARIISQKVENRCCRVLRICSFIARIRYITYLMLQWSSVITFALCQNVEKFTIHTLTKQNKYFMNNCGKLLFSRKTVPRSKSQLGLGSSKQKFII